MNSNSNTIFNYYIYVILKINFCLNINKNKIISKMQVNGQEIISDENNNSD